MYVEFSLDADARGNVKYGLAEGNTIKGFMDRYSILFDGFDEVTNVDSTEVTYTGVGEEEGTIQVTWTDLDGKLNKFEPKDVTEVAMDGNFEKGYFGVYEGHAIKLLKIDKNDADLYRAEFLVAGKEVNTNYVDLTENATLVYGAINGGFEATVNLVDNKNVEVFDMDWEFTIGGQDMDLFNPTLNLENITDAVPFAVFADENEGFAVMYDNNTEKDVWGEDDDADEAMVVINENGDALVNTAQEKIQTDDENHITGFGILLSADGITVDVSIPEKARQSKVVIRELYPEDKVCLSTIPISTNVLHTVNSPILDTNAIGTFQIAIGGPWVNTVTATMVGQELTTVAEGTGYLRTDGNNLFVAGMTATDTQTAVTELIGLLE